MLLKKITHAKCMVLDHRNGEWPRIKKEWAQLGVNVDKFLMGKGNILPSPSYDFYDGHDKPPIYPNSVPSDSWRNNSGPYQFWKAQKQIMQQFIDEDGDLLLFLEDDSFVEDDFEEILGKCENFLEEKDWDMIYFGCYHHADSWKYTEHPNIVFNLKSGGWHSVLLSKKICQILLQFDPLGPYDWICGKYILPQIIAYAIYPCIVSQLDNNYSYIEQTVLPKPSRWKKP